MNTTFIHAGPSFFINESRRKMSAEDIRNALAIAR